MATEGAANDTQVSGWRQQFDNVDVEGRSQPLDIVERDVSLSAFNGANVDAVQVGQIRKCLLRQATLRSERTQSASKTLTRRLNGSSLASHRAGGSRPDDFGSTDLK